MPAAFPNIRNVRAQVHVHGQVCASSHVHVKVMFLDVRLIQPSVVSLVLVVVLATIGATNRLT